MTHVPLKSRVVRSGGAAMAIVVSDSKQARLDNFNLRYYTCNFGLIGTTQHQDPNE